MSITRLLVDYSKNSPSTFDTESVRQFLIPYYHNDMSIKDVLSIVLGALEEVVDEPRYEVQYGKRIWKKIIVSMFDDKLGEPSIETIHDVYNKYIKEILYTFRYTRKDWY